jgi:hypothetical protein
VNVSITERLAFTVEFKVGTWNSEAIKCCIAVMCAVCEGEQYSDIGISI